jgi:gentisate 1,2-dioxygenase
MPEPSFGGLIMHRLRSSILAGEGSAAAAIPSSLEACRRQGPQEGAPERRSAAQRKADRHRELVERAGILFRGKRGLVRVINVSKGGLTIESSIDPEIGESLSIHLPGAEAPIEAAVRWIKRGRIGLAVEAGAISVAG